MEDLFFGGAGLALAIFYVAVLVLLGWAGYRKRRVDSLGDFYLAGNSLGFVVLLATLYASQYSGNTFLGYTGQAYRIGFAWIMSVGMMMSVVVIYLLFAPALHDLAHRFSFVTPGDWVRYRFADRRLALLVSLIMAVALSNYLYAQFLAMGHVVMGMSAGRIPFWAGVVGLAAVIGVYETLGGLRSVAWTDVVQAVMLLLGLVVVLVVAWPEIGHLGEVTRDLLVREPQLVQVPSWRGCGQWLSSIALLGLGAAVYPHAIQRIFAARDAAVLRRSLRVMVCMPLATTLVVFLLGIAAHGLIPPREGLDTDAVMPALLATLVEGGTVARWGVALVLMGALAAIMSTADSALLSLSSILARDVIGAWRTDLPEASLTRLGKWLSWLIIALLVALAVQPPTTLWRLIEIKMELLIQVAPLFILGVRSLRLDAPTARRALYAGTSLAVGAFLLGIDDVGGIHAGTWAFAVNMSICAIGIRRSRREEQSRGLRRGFR
jgi:SSS family solute:Na+ symporter